MSRTSVTPPCSRFYALFRVEAMDCTAPDCRTRCRDPDTPHLGAPMRAITMGDVISNLVSLSPHFVAVRPTSVSQSRSVEAARVHSIKLWHDSVSHTMPRWNCAARLFFHTCIIPSGTRCVTLLYSRVLIEDLCQKCWRSRRFDRDNH